VQLNIRLSVLGASEKKRDSKLVPLLPLAHGNPPSSPRKIKVHTSGINSNSPTDGTRSISSADKRTYLAFLDTQLHHQWSCAQTNALPT